MPERRATVTEHWSTVSGDTKMCLCMCGGLETGTAGRTAAWQTVQADWDTVGRDGWLCRAAKRGCREWAAVHAAHVGVRRHTVHTK